MATAKKTAAAAADTPPSRSPRDVMEEVAARQAEALATATPVPPEKSHELQLEFMASVCEALGV